MMKTALMLVMGLLLLAGVAYALPVSIDSVEIDGTDVFPDETTSLDIERGQEVDVRVEFTALDDLENVELLAFIAGYEFNHRPGESISKVIGPLDLAQGSRFVRTLKLRFPFDLDVDEYKLRLVFSDRTGEPTIESFTIKVDTPRHAVHIADITLVPGQKVRAGEALITKVRVENRGQRTEKDLRVSVELPDLGLKQQGFINEIEDTDEQEETEDLLLRIPVCTKEGKYKVLVRVDYDRNRESTSATRELHVTESDLCEKTTTPKTTVSVGNDLASIKQGQGGVYSVTVANSGRQSRSYSLSVEAPQGLTTRISPTAAAVLNPGASQTFYVFIGADTSTPVGPHVLTATLRSGTEVLQQIPLTANIVSGEDPFRRALEVGAIVALIVIIVVALVAGLSRRRERGGKTTTYY